jgi:drug/metabolite transporter (DMT)-like permease
MTLWDKPIYDAALRTPAISDGLLLFLYLVGILLLGVAVVYKKHRNKLLFVVFVLMIIVGIASDL